LTGTVPEPDQRSFRRPLPVAVLCLLGWLLLGLAGWRILARWGVFESLPRIRAIGGPAALLLAAVILWGYWRMRRWALWVAALGLMARVALSISGMLPLRPLDLIWPGLLLFPGLAYYRRLR
jgi:hypothetical protein